MNILQMHTPTMSSRVIAELVGSRHDNVRASMICLRNKGLITVTETQEPTPGGGKPVTVLHVNKRDSYVVVAQLSPEFTARLVDRWQELEADAAPKTTAEWLVVQAQALVEQERRLAANEARITKVEDRLEQIQTASEFYTVVGWVSRFGTGYLPLHTASKMGRAATKYCKEHGIAMGSTPDPRFGQVNTYPKDVLEYLFDLNPAIAA